MRYIDNFGINSIAYLTADREFGGRVFLAWLTSQRISFVIRLRGNVRVANVRGEKKTARGLFWHSKIGEAKCLGEREVFGGDASLPLQVSGMRLVDGDFLIVVSDRPSPCGDLLLEYSKRWGIETLFGSLKKRGRETLFAIRFGGDSPAGQ